MITLIILMIIIIIKTIMTIIIIIMIIIILIIITIIIRLYLQLYRRFSHGYNKKQQKNMSMLGCKGSVPLSYINGTTPRLDGLLTLTRTCDLFEI